MPDHHQAMPPPPRVDQHDIAATLAALGGSAVPLNSLGVIIEPLMEFQSEEERLAARFYNAHQLAQVLKKNDNQYQSSKFIHNICYISYKYYINSLMSS